ncbi:MAG: PKD domain-containing protein [Candidatus Bathyarchaeia archaeon]
MNLTGVNQTFVVRITNSHVYSSYDTRLVIALNDVGYANLVSMVVNGTNVPKLAFKRGTPKPYTVWTWPSGDVYPTWFNDTVVNVGKISGGKYVDLVVYVSFSDASGVRMHFDAYGKDSWGNIIHNDVSHDSTVLLNVGAPPPQPPVASFVFNPQNPEVGQIVTFDASASYDSDGYIVNYTWNFGDGTPVVTENDPITTHAYADYGNFTVKLTVVDNSSLTGEITSVIHVCQRPTASFTFSPQEPLVDETVVFDASASTPDGGTIISYTWDFGDGNVTTVSEPVITHAYAYYGTYTVTLNVTDSEGKWDTDSQTITVEKAPVADFCWAPLYPQRGETVTFDASASTPNGGTIVSYTWDFGDGNITTVSQPTITHVYSATGDYLVTLNVTDSEGRWDTESKIISVVARQYYLTVKTDPVGVATIPGEGWYPEGASVELTAPDNVPVSDGVRYKFSYWDVDGTPVNGNPITVVVDANKTATAHYTLEYYLTVSSPFGTVGGQGWYASGSTAYATLNTDVVDHGNGTRRVFTHWSGDASGTNYAQSNPIVMDGPKTAVANWKTQYKLIVRTNGLGTKTTNVYNGTTVLGTASDSTPFEAWYDAYAFIQLDIDSPIEDNPTVYTFVQWTGDISGSDRPAPVTLNSPKDITANYKTEYEQYAVTFTQTGLDSSAVGIVLTVDGDVKTFSDLPFTIYVEYGTVITYSYSSEVSSATAGKRFVLTGVTGPSSPITVTGPVMVIGNYKTQFEITFDQSGVNSDFAGTVLIVDGIEYSVGTLPVSFWWDSESVHDFAFQSPLVVAVNSKQYVWTSTTGSSTLQSGSITVSASGSVVGNYKTQYYLTVSSPYGSPTPTSGWFDDGTPITASVTSPVSGPTGTRYVCTGWTGTGSVPASGTGTTVNFIITQPSSITWNWKTQYLLTVVTDPSGLSPQPTRNPLGEAGPVNSWWYDSGTSVTLTAQTVSEYTFNHWDVDGVSKGSGVNPTMVVMDAPHTATAHYTQIQPLTVSISPSTAKIKIGESVIFTSTVSGGVKPYSYQWYLNGTPVSGANGTSWTFTPTATGTYIVYLIVTDASANTAKSNEATVTVAPSLTVSISPTSASILLGEQVTFTSTVSGGYTPYKYQWYLNDEPVSGAIGNSWNFTPTTSGRYYVYLEVTDANGNKAQSETARIMVSTVQVGGYTTSITKQTSTFTPQITAYAALTLLFGAILSLTKRKRK